MLLAAVYLLPYRFQKFFKPIMCYRGFHIPIASQHPRATVQQCEAVRVQQKYIKLIRSCIQVIHYKLKLDQTEFEGMTPRFYLLVMSRCGKETILEKPHNMHCIYLTLKYKILDHCALKNRSVTSNTSFVKGNQTKCLL